MSPSFPSLDIRNVCRGYSILGSNLLVRALVFSDGSSLFFGKFCKSIFRTAIGNIAPFRHHVRHVVLMRSKKQMMNGYATTNVAPMKNAHTAWNGSVNKLPYKSVKFSDSATPLNGAVSLRFYAARPNATAAFRNSYRVFFNAIKNVLQCELSHNTPNKVIEVFAGKLCVGTAAVATACPGIHTIAQKEPL